MSRRARAKRMRYWQASIIGKVQPKNLSVWPKGHPPKNVKGQSGRTVIIVNSGIFDITAKVAGTHDTNRYVQQLTEHHMRRYKVPETHYGVYTFPSKNVMRKWLRSWHTYGTWKPRLRNFKIEWLS